VLKALFYANLHKLVERLNSPVYNFVPPDSDSVPFILCNIWFATHHRATYVVVNNRISDL